MRYQQLLKTDLLLLVLGHATHANALNGIVLGPSGSSPWGGGSSLEDNVFVKWVTFYSVS